MIIEQVRNQHRVAETIAAVHTATKTDRAYLFVHPLDVLHLSVDFGDILRHDEPSDGWLSENSIGTIWTVDVYPTEITKRGKVVVATALSSAPGEKAIQVTLETGHWDISIPDNTGDVTESGT